MARARSRVAMAARRRAGSSSSTWTQCRRVPNEAARPMATAGRSERRDGAVDTAHDRSVARGEEPEIARHDHDRTRTGTGEREDALPSSDASCDTAARPIVDACEHPVPGEVDRRVRCVLGLMGADHGRSTPGGGAITCSIPCGRGNSIRPAFHLARMDTSTGPAVIACRAADAARSAGCRRGGSTATRWACRCALGHRTRRPSRN